MLSKKPRKCQVMECKLTEAEGGHGLIKKLAAKGSSSLAIDVTYPDTGILFHFGSDD